MNQFDQEKLPEQIRKKQAQRQAIISNIIAGLITLVIGVIIFLLFYILKGQHLIDALNGVSVAMVVIFSIAILIILSRFGAFDTFAYGFKQLGAMMFSKNPAKYDDMIDYRNKKNEERKSKPKYYFAMLIVGVIFLIATIVLQIIFNASIQ